MLEDIVERHLLETLPAGRAIIEQGVNEGGDRCRAEQQRQCGQRPEYRAFSEEVDRRARRDPPPRDLLHDLSFELAHALASRIRALRAERVERPAQARLATADRTAAFGRNR